MVFEFANIILAICKQFIVCIIMSYYFHFSVWNWSNAMNIQSAPRMLMAWCWSTRASVATVLSRHLCVSSCSWINQSDFFCQGQDKIYRLYRMFNGPFVRGIHLSPVDSPHRSQWRGAYMFSLICVWTNGWANNRDADDLICHRAHYDVTVMSASVAAVIDICHLS